MEEANGFFEVAIPGIQLGVAKSYEVVKLEANGQVSRLGWAIEAETLGERHWVALAVVSETGDSFLGSFKSAHEALLALHRNEQDLPGAARRRAAHPEEEAPGCLVPFEGEDL
jgi:hypothetical protein